MIVYALDCEMVGSHNTSMIARVSIVNRYGQVVMDDYVKPQRPVTDYRTFVSGIRKVNLESGGKVSEVRKKATKILSGNILVGHSLKYDLKDFKLPHPRKDRRDLAKYPPLMLKGQPQSLKTLAKLYLGRDIQNGEHDSVKDAKACMDIYLKIEHQWEGHLHFH